MVKAYNKSRYFIPKMSVFNTSKVLCNSHVMFVYVIIVHNYWRSLLWRSLLLMFAFIMDELQSTYILLPLIVYRMRYDDWKLNSCRIIQLYHVFFKKYWWYSRNLWYFFLYSTCLKALGIQKKYQKNCSNIHWYFIKTHGLTGKYYLSKKKT